MNLKKVTIKKKGLLWYKTGHIWIYRDDLRRTGEARPGEIVDVIDERDRFLGKALYSEKSKIALRLLTRENEEINDAFWRRRITEALERRGKRLTAKGEAVRLIYSEGDGLPGLLADRYAEWLVLQTLNPAIDARLDLIGTILAEILAPKGIVCRNDANTRSLEGLPLEKKTLRGDAPGLIEISEGDIRYLVDIWDGHKTGAYLDQSENRIVVSRYARGRVLDCFSYQGHFALHMAHAAETVTAVESSKAAISLMEKNCVLNGLDNIKPVQENVFDLLRRYHGEKERFDTIVLDPPPLARKKSHIDGAIRGYKEVNLRAMHLLKPGGVLATFCCSHSIPRDLFFDILREAAADARCSFSLLDELAQGRDHPILLNVPETAYLKGFILRK